MTPGFIFVAVAFVCSQVAYWWLYRIDKRLWKAYLRGQRASAGATGPWHRWPDERPATGKHLVVRVCYRGAAVADNSEIVETVGYEGCYFEDSETGADMDAIMQGVTHWAYITPPLPQPVEGGDIYA